MTVAVFSVIAMCHDISTMQVSPKKAFAPGEWSTSFFKLGNCRLPCSVLVKPECTA